MLTTLSTVKTRLAISEADTTNDAILTAAIKSVSARFDKETNRPLARTYPGDRARPGRCGWRPRQPPQSPTP